jgi:hypothetical protein
MCVCVEISIGLKHMIFSGHKDVVICAGHSSWSLAIDLGLFLPRAMCYAGREYNRYDVL